MGIELGCHLDPHASMPSLNAYHAATIRTVLFDRDLARQANAISAARDSLDGPSDDDQGITINGRPISCPPTATASPLAVPPAACSTSST